jgi:hypothetical protein
LASSAASIEMKSGSMAAIKRKGIAALIAIMVIASAVVAVGISVPKVKEITLTTSHSDIIIEGDQNLTAAQGVVQGSGTAEDPFVIEGWNIPPSSSPAIEVSNTSSWLVIRNCTITGNSWYQDGVGVSIRLASNVTMENLMIYGLETGISVDGLPAKAASDIRVRTCSVTECRNGIVIKNATDLALYGNLVTDSILSGIMVENSSRAEMERNQVFSDIHYYDTLQLKQLHASLTAMIVVADCSNSSIKGNRISGGFDPFLNLIVLRCRDIEVSNNNLVSSTSAGATADISGCQNASVCNNSGRLVMILTENSRACWLADNWLWGNSFNPMIQIRSSSNVDIVRNNVSHSDNGIAAWNLNDSRVIGNAIANCSGSALSLSGDNITIERNLLTSSALGLDIKVRNTTIRENLIESNGPGSIWEFDGGGMSSYNSDGVLVENNSFLDNTPAVTLNFCSNFSFIHNNMSGFITLPSCSNMSFLGNSMYDVNVSSWALANSTVWDRGYPVGGNFWSQYSHVDLNGGPNQDIPGSDGIGDTPFQVVGVEAIDHYPLMNAKSTPDESAPFTEAEILGNEPNTGWYTSAVNITLRGYDVHSDVSNTHYRIDNASWSEYGGTVRLATDGIHLLEYYSVDSAGNEETAWSKTVKIDTKPPECITPISPYMKVDNTRILTLRFDFVDSTSGISYFLTSPSSQRVAPLYGGYSTVPAAEFVLSNGNQTCWVYTYDEAGNENTTAIRIYDTLNEDRDPLSLGGPFGPWYVAALMLSGIAILILGSYFASLWIEITYAPAKRHPRTGRPGEVDKEEVVDGYPRFIRKV